MVWSYKDDDSKNNNTWKIIGQVLEAGYYQNVVSYGFVVLTLCIMLFSLAVVALALYFVSGSMAKKRQSILKKQEESESKDQEASNKLDINETEIQDSIIKQTSVENALGSLSNMFKIKNKEQNNENSLIN